MDPIPIQRFRQLFSPRIWKRGEEYYYESRAFLVDSDEDFVEYAVSGGQDYRVIIYRDSLNSRGFRSYCSCPFQGPCKHLAAAIMDGLDENVLAESQDAAGFMENPLAQFKEETREIDLDEKIHSVSSLSSPPLKPERAIAPSYRLFFLLQWDHPQRFDSLYQTYLTPYMEYIKKDGNPGRVKPFSGALEKVQTSVKEERFLRLLGELVPDNHYLLSLLPDLLALEEKDLRIEREGGMEPVELKALETWDIRMEPLSYRDEIYFEPRVFTGKDPGLSPRDFFWEHNHHMGLLIPKEGPFLYYFKAPYSVLNYLEGLLEEGSFYSSQELQKLLTDNPSTSIKMKVPGGRLLHKRILPKVRIYVKGLGSQVELEPVLLYGSRELSFQSSERSVMEENEQGRTLYSRHIDVERALILKTLDLHKEEILSRHPLRLSYSLEEFIQAKAEAVLSRGGEIYFKKGRKPLLMKPLQFRVSSGIKWLEVQLELGGQTVHLLEGISSSGLLQFEGGYKLLSPQEQEKLNALAARGKLKDGSLRLPPGDLSALALLQEDIDAESQPELGRWLEALKRLKQGFSPSWQGPPKGLNATLRPYQEEGLRWLNFLYDFYLGGILADDMGLGKTLQAIAMMLYARQQGSILPFLILAPVSTLRNWQKELERFSPQQQTHLFHGQDRRPWPKGFCGVVLSSYHTLLRDQDLFLQSSWDLVVLDESQALKNRQSRSYRSVKQLHPRSFLALSGTPVENHIGELWALMDLLNPGILGDFKSFMQRYRKPLIDGNKRVIEELKSRIQPFLLRRTKGQVARELPEREEIILRVELSRKERKYYETQKRAHIEEIQRLKAMGAKAFQVSSALIQALNALRQIAISPALQGGPVFSSKLECALDKIKEAREEGHKVLVFSQYTRVLTMMEPLLEKAALPYVRLDGSLSGSQREKRVRSFQQEADLGVFLISIKAGGTGLNLVEADYVLILDPWWNPAVENQAIDRTHRIGQTKAVTAYRLIAEETVEEKVLDLQAQKRDLVEGLLEGSSSPLGKMDAGEILNLF